MAICSFIYLFIIGVIHQVYLFLWKSKTEMTARSQKTDHKIGTLFYSHPNKKHSYFNLLCVLIDLFGLFFLVSGITDMFQGYVCCTEKVCGRNFQRTVCPQRLLTLHFIFLTFYSLFSSVQFSLKWKAYNLYMCSNPSLFGYVCGHTLSPPCLESQGCHLISSFYLLSCY